LSFQIASEFFKSAGFYAPSSAVLLLFEFSKLNADALTQPTSRSFAINSETIFFFFALFFGDDLCDLASKRY